MVTAEKFSKDSPGAPQLRGNPLKAGKREYPVLTEVPVVLAVSVIELSVLSLSKNKKLLSVYFHKKPPRRSKPKDPIYFITIKKNYLYNSSLKGSV